MSRLTIERSSAAEEVMAGLCIDMARRLGVNPQNNCPVEACSAFLRMCAAQSCGKCVPCRIGLAKMADLIDAMLEGEADENSYLLLCETAEAVFKTADCAIGFEAGRLALVCVAAYKDEFLSHIRDKRCTAKFRPVPCREACPAHIDIPGYCALAKAGRLADAVRIIRNDNPLPSSCAYVCEHPCEDFCRRTLLDAPLNIRGIKKYIVDEAGVVEPPHPLEATGKCIAVIGGGPSGLSCAYYLRLMGHDVTIYEQNDSLGGMLRYGIPRYRLPEEALQLDLDAILSCGIHVKYGVTVGIDISTGELDEEYDSIYVAIGAHGAKKLGIEGEDSTHVLSAVELLHGTSGGKGTEVDLSNKTVAIIGGGNVAMDAVRTSIRLGASSVTCLYRRRLEDMSALKEEIEAALAEGCEIRTLLNPVRIEAGEEKALRLYLQPQIPGEYRDGRPGARPLDAPEVIFDCDFIITAIGQDIVSDSFAASGIEVNRKRFVFEDDCLAKNQPDIYVGGDCATGPATVIRAIAAGKVAAANIDARLGFAHDVHDAIDVPAAGFFSTNLCGRIEVPARPAGERKDDGYAVETSMSEQEAMQECSRCLRCDAYGMGSMREGRSRRW